MPWNKSGYKYETPYKVPGKIVHWWSNDAVTLKMGDTEDMQNIYNIKTNQSEETSWWGQADPNWHTVYILIFHTYTCLEK